MRILAKTIYRELLQSGQVERDVMVLASELLALLASDVKNRRRSPGIGADGGSPEAR